MAAATGTIRLPRPLQPVRLPEREELAQWAWDHLRIEIGDRGPVPTEVMQAYTEYHLDYRRRAQKRLVTQGKIDLA